MGSPVVGRALIAGGVVAVGLGIVAMWIPGVAALFGGSDAFVPLLGILALVQTVRTASAVWNSPWERATLPDAHRVESPTPPGETVDRTFELSSYQTQTDRRARLTRYLRHVAVRILVAETGDSTEVVRTRLERGTWTDDPVGAALFTEEYVPTWRDRIRSRLGRETLFQRRVRHAVAALEERMEGPDE
ncbi:DUF7269 family protein [Natrinema longum]|uniref:Uncharacterized protein n=1 Tax=Natrinema longum TaxID=370324 RepID=A0A8A2U830_9EURY|nr:hypothetical protein [Natrinema longum]MBZ6493681.1 hypothetical protein [Natrinema longum]QSW84979.1 hypothetical protein J0X27_16245 [Natrinema longum]